jgi:methionyl aminopeptidase
MNNYLIKTDEELKIMRDGGKVLAEIVDLLLKEIVEGNTSIEVDKYANFLCKRFKVKPAFLGYGNPDNPFPGVICANLNEVIVHGVPNKIRFKKGDIFGLDMGIIYQGFFLDMSFTAPIDVEDTKIKRFLDKTYTSMTNGINAAIPGNCVGDISFAMYNGLLDKNFSIMRHFVGHGIGKRLHEEPEIPGVGMKPGQGLRLRPGMVLAVESISVMGPTNEYQISKDRWTVYTKNKKYLSGLYEHTVIVTENGPEIITKF